MRSEPVTITLDYIGLRWDGTIEGADAICDEIAFWSPRWTISRTSDRELELRITSSMGHDSPGPFILRTGWLLVCDRPTPESSLRPQRVVNEAAQGQ